MGLFSEAFEKSVTITIVDTEKLNKVYGVDINQEYLTISKKRYENLSDTLHCL